MSLVFHPFPNAKTSSADIRLLPSIPRLVSRFKSPCNEEKLPNILHRDFNSHAQMDAVSDLTYVRVGHKWNYICILLDLCTHEIIGYSVGAHKDHDLVSQAFASVKGDLSRIKFFYTDRGSEFKISISTRFYRILISPAR